MRRRNLSVSKSPSCYYDSQAVREETGANLRNYWILGPDSSNHGHPAAFPRELARRCILLGSRESDVVLDPFGGSGTTGMVANNLGRKAILVELVKVCRFKERSQLDATQTLDQVDIASGHLGGGCLGDRRIRKSSVQLSIQLDKLSQTAKHLRGERSRPHKLARLRQRAAYNAKPMRLKAGRASGRLTHGD
ncbi:MAG: site-specific DNA-methyltransferase [Pirellulaceae bacterium]